MVGPVAEGMQVQVEHQGARPTETSIRSGLFRVTPTRLAVVAALVVAVVIALGPSEFLDGQLHGPDAHSRINRLEYSIESRDWSHAVYPRSNAPFGETIQWTIALDLIIMAGAAPLTLFLDWKQALFVSGSLLGPALHMVAAALVVWIARAGLGLKRGLIWVGLLFVVQINTIIPFLVGRPDHHGLIVVLYMAMLGSHARACHDIEHRTGWAATAAALLALGVWVSPEGLVTSAASIIWLAGSWLVHSDSWRVPLRRFAQVGAVALTGLWLVDPPPSGRLEFEYDRLSLGHVWPFVVLAVFAIALTSTRAARPLSTVALRATASTVAVLMCGGLLFLTTPDLFAGPLVEVPAAMGPMFLDDSIEWTPLFENGVTVRVVVATLGISIVALATYVWRFGRGDSLVPLLALNHLMFVALVGQQVRWAMYLGVLDALGLAWILDKVLGRLDKSRLGSARLAVSALAVVATLVAGPLLLTLAPSVSGEQGDDPSNSPSLTLGTDSAPIGNCDAQTASAELARIAPRDSLASAGSSAPIVLAPLFWGPEILYTTNFSVIGTPMHRNDKGISWSYQVMAAPADEAHELLVERGVTHIAWCHGQEWAPTISPDHVGGLHDSLLDENYPHWLGVAPVFGHQGGLRIGHVSDHIGAG